MTNLKAMYNKMAGELIAASMAALRAGRRKRIRKYDWRKKADRAFKKPWEVNE